MKLAIGTVLALACAAGLALVLTQAPGLAQEGALEAAPEADPGSVEAHAEVRRRWANGFLDGPTVHLELARFHHDAGRLELAQRICEETRYRFGDDAFDEAYWEVFEFEQMPEPVPALLEVLGEVQAALDEGEAETARTLAQEALATWPDSCELYFLLGMAKDGCDEPADADFARAVELAPTSPFIQGWTAHRQLKRKQDKQAALEGYLRTYFLDPHFYDTEFAEARIAEDLGPARSFEVYRAASDAGDFRTVMSLERYWGTERAVHKLNKDWRPEFAADAVRLLAHDSSEVRWLAMEVLRANAGEEFDGTLDELLQDPDLRVRGLAIYLAVSARGEAAFPDARRFLASDCPLLRFDAISALRMHGGEAGAALVRKHAEHETHEVLKTMCAR